MKKRFTDADKWTSNMWFRELSPSIKLFWLYLLDACDAVGVWEVDIKLAEFVTGLKIDKEKAIEALEERIEPYSTGKKWVIKDFVTFQYGELNSNSRPHQTYIKLLERHTLSKGYPKGIYTLKEKEKEKDKEQDKEKEKDIQPKTRKNKPKTESKFNVLKDGYMEWYDETVGKEYYWDAASASACKQLEKKIDHTFKGIYERIPDLEDVNVVWTKVLNGLPKWYIENGASIKIINSKYNEIIAGLSGKKQSGISQEYIDDVKRRVQGITIN